MLIPNLLVEFENCIVDSNTKSTPFKSSWLENFILDGYRL